MRAACERMRWFWRPLYCISAFPHISPFPLHFRISNAEMQQCGNAAMQQCFTALHRNWGMLSCLCKGAVSNWAMLSCFTQLLTYIVVWGHIYSTYICFTQKCGNAFLLYTVCLTAPLHNLLCCFSLLYWISAFPHYCTLRHWHVPPAFFFLGQAPEYSAAIRKVWTKAVQLRQSERCTN